MTFTTTGVLTELVLWGDGSTAYDILVWGVQLETGSSATAYHVPTVDALFNPKETPTWNATGINLSANTKGGTAIRQAHATVSALSWYAAVRNHPSAGTEIVLADIDNYLNGESGRTGPDVERADGRGHGKPPRHST